MRHVQCILNNLAQKISLTSGLAVRDNRSQPCLYSFHCWHKTKPNFSNLFIYFIGGLQKWVFEIETSSSLPLQTMQISSCLVYFITTSQKRNLSDLAFFLF